MNLPRTLLMFCIVILAAGYFFANTKGREEQVITEAKPEGMQYSVVVTDYLGVRKIISVGTLKECVDLQNAARRLNNEGGKIKGVECIPS